MGEAKRRGTFEERKAQAESNLIRGIITPPGKISITNNSYYLDKQLDEDEMLYLSLYWDKILIPTGNIHVDTPFEEELISQGVLIRPHSSKIKPARHTVNSYGIIQMESHELYAFGEFVRQKLDAHGEDWVIQHYSQDPLYLPQHRKEQNTLRLKITNILPFPSPNGTFSIDDLLEFKFRRRDQLEALHHTMDELVKRMYLEPIHALKEGELKRFENAVKELDKPLIERFKIIKKSDWEISLSPDIPTLIEKGTAIGSAIIADSHTNIGFPVFSGIATLGSFLSISKKYGFTFNRHAKKDLKLEYISGAKSENIIP